MDKREIFHVIKPGILTTLQDLGRHGYQQYGIPVSGVMDTYALQVANILVGNLRNEAGLEVTLVGPSLEAKTTITVSITGAELSPSLNGDPIEMWKSLKMKPGDRLIFAKRKKGMRAYIAVAGGFDVSLFLGSKSRDRNSGLGMELEKNLTLSGYVADATTGIFVHDQLIPIYKSEVEIGIVEGPHTSSFTANVREAFFNNTYKVDANSNRMGYRLLSDNTIQPHQAGIWSDPVPFGGIQIPGNGEPIILMADRQTTGGYPRIGTVISTDLPKIAQLVPHDKLHFYPISVEEAQEKAKQLERELQKLKTFCRSKS